jgi:hypothetical protein
MTSLSFAWYGIAGQPRTKRHESIASPRSFVDIKFWRDTISSTRRRGEKKATVKSKNFTTKATFVCCDQFDFQRLRVSATDKIFAFFNGFG